jgi:hypothetical protein
MKETVTVTLEDIEKELDPSKQVGFMSKRMAQFKLDAINTLIKKLKTQEELTDAATVKALLTGQRKLTSGEYEAAVKKFGVTGVNAIEAMEHLTKAQKRYLFKRMGYDPEEVQ